MNLFLLLQIVFAQAIKGWPIDVVIAPYRDGRMLKTRLRGRTVHQILLSQRLAGDEPPAPGPWSLHPWHKGSVLVTQRKESAKGGDGRSP